MTNRKKRLQKGIESLREQIEFHVLKRDHAQEEGQEELVDYYNKEIKAKERTLQEKQDILDKQ
jgi:hypothetical protein